MALITGPVPDSGFSLVNAIYDLVPVAANYTVVSLNEVQTVDPAGQLTDMVEAIFTIPNRAGQFSVRVPHTSGWTTAIENAISTYADEVIAVYAA